jgi:hypothetical protein
MYFSFVSFCLIWWSTNRISYVFITTFIDSGIKKLLRSEQCCFSKTTFVCWNVPISSSLCSSLMKVTSPARRSRSPVFASQKQTRFWFPHALLLNANSQQPAHSGTRHLAAGYLCWHFSTLHEGTFTLLLWMSEYLMTLLQLQRLFNPKEMGGKVIISVKHFRIWKDTTVQLSAFQIE